MNVLVCWTKEHGRGMQERIKLPPSRARTYNNPAVNQVFVHGRESPLFLTGASAGVALAMPWRLLAGKKTPSWYLLFMQLVAKFDVHQIHFRAHLIYGQGCYWLIIDTGHYYRGSCITALCIGWIFMHIWPFIFGECVTLLLRYLQFEFLRCSDINTSHIPLPSHLRSLLFEYKISCLLTFCHNSVILKSEGSLLKCIDQKSYKSCVLVKLQSNLSAVSQPIQNKEMQ